MPNYLESAIIPIQNVEMDTPVCNPYKSGPDKQFESPPWPTLAYRWCGIRTRTTISVQTVDTVMVGHPHASGTSNVIHSTSSQ